VISRARIAPKRGPNPWEADGQQIPAEYDRQPPRWRPMTLTGVSDASHTPPSEVRRVL
jgi:hypothetical protein